MTRFARAKGSKASNERAPEEGTPWSVMLEQLDKSKKDQEEAKKRKEAEEMRLANYSKFLDDQKTAKRKATWCEFPEDKKQKVEEKPEKSTTKSKKDKSKKQKKDSPVKHPENLDSSTHEKKNKLKHKTHKHENTEQSSSADDKIQKSPKKDVNSENSNVQEQPKENFKKLEMPTQKPLQKKKQKDGKFNRRKPEIDNSFHLVINGEEVDLVRFEGFPILKKDAERIGELKNNMLNKGIPRNEVARTIKLERRRAEKALARLKKQVCYNCRKGGHNLSDCPDLKNTMQEENAFPDSICFKCGSTEHRQFECRVQRGADYKFASCFICKEQGHIARQCPDNPKGLYPNGGGCKQCGDVTHFKKDCPTMSNTKETPAARLDTLADNYGLEDVEKSDNIIEPSSVTKQPKHVKF